MAAPSVKELLLTEIFGRGRVHARLIMTGNIHWTAMPSEIRKNDGRGLHARYENSAAAMIETNALGQHTS